MSEHVGIADTRDVSSYLQYLPAIYQADPFLGRFLLIAETILQPIEQMIDTMADYFDPHLTPEELLPWLASWVDLDLDENWPLEQRRELVSWAVTLYRWRGTRRGLRQHLQLYTGLPPLIVENFDGMRLGQDAALGLNTRLGEQQAHAISVTVMLDGAREVNEQVVRKIIEAELPAHVSYTLDVLPTGPE